MVLENQLSASISGGMNILWIIFWVTTKLDYFLELFPVKTVLKSLLKFKVQKGNIF